MHKILPLFLFAACLPIPDGRFECRQNDECPTDWICFEQRCYEEMPSPVDGGVDSGFDGSTEEDVGPETGPLDAGPPDVPPGDAPPLPPRPVDVLFVIDNSGTMEEEHLRLREALPTLLTGLALGTTGSGDFPPIRDMHVGVVTTHLDLGPFGNTVATCQECQRDYGYDGVMIQEPVQPSEEAGICTRLIPDCAEFGERYLRYDASPDALARLQRGVECKTRVGHFGCGFEQPLEAALKALSPGSRMDFRDSGGHGDGANEGFLRDDSVLLVVFVTDEEDCSSPSSELFNLGSEVYPSDRINVRCIENADAVHPVSRYVEGLLAVHPAEQLVVASLVGVPLDLATSSPDEVLESPEMEYNIVMPGSSLASPAHVCTGPNAEAGAAPRFFQVARGLELEGGGTVSESICAQDYAPFFGRVLDALAERVAR